MKKKKRRNKYGEKKWDMEIEEKPYMSGSATKMYIGLDAIFGNSVLTYEISQLSKL